MFSTNVSAFETYLDYTPDAADIQQDLYFNTEIPINGEDFMYYTEDTDEGTFIMLPLREVLNDYADIYYETNGVITVICGTLDATFTVGDRQYVINGEKAMLDASPKIVDGITYVPATFFSNVFGFWLDETREGVIDLFMPSDIIDNI